MTRVREAWFEPSGDRGLLVRFGTSDPSSHVRAVTRSIFAKPPDGLIDLHPAQDSVLVEFDPVHASHASIEQQVAAAIVAAPRGVRSDGRTVEIPVCYEGAHAPDLEDVARHAALSPEAVISLHSGATYAVEFFGFAPGFAYLSGLPPELAAPRLPTPRKAVPPGSVGIGGGRTGVYPFATPGGWRLIGRTPIRMFDPSKDPMSRLALGDRVRFVPISGGRYESDRA